jgi:type II secretory pathway pseudopilin PulG
MVSPLIIVVSLFGLSLFAAIILFKFLKSTALITNEKYQAGGAIAGFIIVYGMLHGSFTQLADYSQTIRTDVQTIGEQKTRLEQLSKFTQESTLTGTVTPNTPDTLVLISAWEGQADLGGEFSLKAPCLVGNDAVKLIITQQGRHFVKLVKPGESKIDVKLPPH